MTPDASQWSYRPRITFQDTNVVGNVYFLSYFRWQFECFEEWRRQQRTGNQRQVELATHFPAHCSTSFTDPIGATVGDRVEVSSDVVQTTGGCSASSTIRKHVDGVESVLATGTITYSDQACSEVCEPDWPVGPCYEFRRPFAPGLARDSLSLLSLQGKCRELFLLDHAPESIRRVASQDLALQTTSASVDILRPHALEAEEVKVELRLEALKCGQMTVRFDYYGLGDGRPVCFARGQQRMSCKRRYSHGLLPTPVPADVLRALRDFTDDSSLLEKITEIEQFSERTPQSSNSNCVP